MKLEESHVKNCPEEDSISRQSFKRKISWLKIFSEKCLLQSSPKIFFGPNNSAQFTYLLQRKLELISEPYFVCEFSLSLKNLSPRILISFLSSTIKSSKRINSEFSSEEKLFLFTKKIYKIKNKFFLIFLKADDNFFLFQLRKYFSLKENIRKWNSPGFSNFFLKNLEKFLRFFRKRKNKT